MNQASRIEGAEAILNADGEVALVVPSLFHRPLAWRETDGGAVDLVVGDRAVASFGCAPDVVSRMVAKGRLLLVEVADGIVAREGWLSRTVATQS